MISEKDEGVFRDCFQALRGSYGQASSVLLGGSRRREFEAAWCAALKDPDVQGVLSQMLFVPGRVPDLEQGALLLGVFDRVHGRPMTLRLFDDVVTTEAEVVDVKKTSDGEGPSYNVTYVYQDEGKCDFRVNRRYGYDRMHSSMNGWSDSALDAYWQLGHRIPCRYRRSHPSEHAVEQP